ncbi:MAG TPA: M28 family peptidase [Herpetosiphonaceae bacterium]|nr:M28 family peptidase [Herpetosiphonaceae bacterium]
MKIKVLVLFSLVLTLAGCGQTAAPPAGSNVLPQVFTAAATGSPTTIAEIPASPTATSMTSTAAPAPAPATATAPVRTPGSDQPSAKFDAARAFGDVQAQMQWVPRSPGTDGWRQTGDYIVNQLKASGWTVEEQRFPYKDVEARNIVGRRGSGPVLIFGAHYDTRRVADSDPDPAKRTLPVPGANDGASGVAVLLELARVLQPETLGREIQLAFFDVEDNGWLDGWEWAAGSRYMAEHLTVQPEAVVIVDMVGDADLQLYYETNSTQTLRESIWATGAALGFRQFIPELRHTMIDDHTAFLEQNIPAVDIIDFDYPSWHTVEDDLDKVSAESLGAVGQTLEVWLLSGQAP